MQSFLQDVASDIFPKYSDLSKIGFVFPNKRASLYFSKYLADISGYAIWSPKVYDIEKLIQRFSGFQIADPIYLLFELYQSYKLVNSGENSPSEMTFDKFYPLGEIILSDFNEIDAYLADVNQLFKIIKDIREIDLIFEILTESQKEVLRQYWKSFSTETTSKQKSKFIELWNCMPALYDNFTQKLRDKRIGYNGLIYRYLSLNIDLIISSNQGIEKFVFIGFNALNKAQEGIFDHLQKIGKAEFYWDVDDYYISDINQEAGLFLRKNLQKFPGANLKKQLPKLIEGNEKEITLVGVPQSIGQAKLLPTLFRENPKLLDVNNTAVVLADEQMLFPVLHSLPENIEQLNVTMGFPLKDTSIYSLLEKYINLQLLSINESNKVYYFNDVLAILRHPNIISIDAEIAQSLITRIENQNRVFIPTNWLTHSSVKLFSLLFSAASDCNSLLNTILDILFEFYIHNTNLDQNQNIIEQEYIYQIYTQVKRLKEVFREATENSNEKITFVTASKLLIKHLQAQTIPFSGEALKGLQILGLMETRNLDFKNLIVLGMNEGLFPSAGSSPSFISQNLREIFELPVQKQQDAIFAYIFYRLLQRSENIIFLYNTINSDVQSGELSRFIQQIKLETNLKIKEIFLSEKIEPDISKSIYIEKNAEIIEALMSFVSKDGNAKRSLSASAINTYLDCKLKFYFRYVADIKELNEVKKEITPDVMGTLTHFVLENIYRELIALKKSNLIEKEDFKILRKNISLQIFNAFHHHFNNSEGEDFKFEGSDLISREIVRKFVEAILEIDHKIAPFEIVSLEDNKGKRMLISILINKEIWKISFKGIIDRVDKKDGEFRIVDYKTGKADKEFADIENLFDRSDLKRPKAVMQTILYSYIFIESHPEAESSVCPVVYNVGEMYKEDFNPYIYLKSDKSNPIKGKLLYNLKDEFVEGISEVLTEIFDIEVGFDQVEDQNNCKYCPYNIICNRKEA